MSEANFKENHWALLDLQYEYLPDGFKLTAYTDVPCHLYCRMTTSPPLKHSLPSMRRGMRITGDIRFCFVVFEDNEQEEAGDTLTHTWLKDVWPICETRWFYFVGEQGGESSVSETAIFKFHFPVMPIPPPPERTVYLTPLGPGNTTELYPFDSAANWHCCVDSENLDDGIASYVTGRTLDYWRTDTYLMSHSPWMALYKIDKLYIEIWTATNYHTGAGLYPQLVVNGNTIEGARIRPLYLTPDGFWVAEHFQKETQEFTVDDEGNPWTWEKLIGIQAGMRLKRGTFGILGVSKVHIRLDLVSAI